MDETGSEYKAKQHVSVPIRQAPRRSRLGLKWRLFMFVAVVLTVGFSIQGYVRISEGYETRRDFLLERAELALDTLARSVRTPLWYLNSQTVERSIDSAVNLQDVHRIILVGVDGINIIRENEMNKSFDHISAFQSITKKIYWTENLSDDERVFLADLTMEISLEQAEDYLRDEIFLTVIVNLSLLLVMIGVFWVFVNKLTAPLEVIAGYLRFIARTQDVDDIRELQIPNQQEENEIGQLSRSLERMRLHSLELLDLRQNLETKVHEQTQELLEARDQAEAASEAKSNFLANVTHELRTPLNGVMGMAQLLKASKLDKKQQDYVSLILNSGDALLVLIGDLLDMAQLEKRQLSLQEDAYQLSQITEGLRRNFDDNLKQSRSELQITNNFVHTDWFLGDSRRIKQVIYALTSNAIKFTNDGRVEIEVSPANDLNLGLCAHIEVKDTGIGIADEHRQKLFENFTQVEGDLTRRFAGMGTGLALVSALVKLMRGKINVESKLGYGSNFTVVLPLKMTESPNKNEKEEPRMLAVPYEGDKGLSVLVAEDNPVNQMLLIKILEQNGHEVVTANNGIEAIDAVEENDFDAILMDIQMPEMDGLTAHRMIRAMGNHKAKTPIVAVTANTLSRDRERYMREGFNAFVGKPVNPKMLLETMYKLCEEQGNQAKKIFEEEKKRLKSDEVDEVVNIDPAQRELDDALAQPLLDQAQWDETSEAIGLETLANLMVEVPEELERYTETICQIHAEKDMEKLRKEAHALKGLAANACLARLAKVASIVSDTARDGATPESYVEKLPAVTKESIKVLYEKMTI